MSLDKIFAPASARAADRMADRAAERIAGGAADRADRADRAAARDDRAARRAARRASDRPEFSALLALIAGAGTKVRADLLRQLPAEGVSLLDKLLEDPSSGVDGATLLSGADGGDAGQAADALRYGLLQERAVDPADAGGLLRQSLATSLPSASASAQSPHAPTTDDMELPAFGRDPADHARVARMLGRIASERGLSVEQLKARGEERAADIRATLDVLLSRAGTPAGLEIAGGLDLPPGSDNAAIAAAASALAAAKATSAADVTVPVRTTEALAPTLRERLDRVIARMKGEYGHDVTVVETARSQERQDHLYEQGRTRAGEVVTWTRDSAHTQGDAVDVIVDGSWKNAEGFARLQRIAREEGLRTLGVRDPGHLELPVNEQRSLTGALASLPGRPDGDVRPLVANGMQGGLARVASVASAATAASVAGVARVGASSSGGFPRGYSSTASTADTITASEGATATIVTGASGGERAGAGDTGGAHHDADASSSRGRPSVIAPVTSDSLDTVQPPAFGAVHTGTPIVTPGGAPSMASAGASSAERVADLQQLRENAPAGSVSRMTLNVDAPDGTQDRITVDLRGTSVGTRIDTDATMADRLRIRTAELQDALGRHGLESDSVRISGTRGSESTDALRNASTDKDALRLQSAQPSASGEGAMNQGQRDRAANAREWDRPDQSRQSREEERESARQGAGQRGQRHPYNGSTS